MNILGISCFYHEAAAALIKDGRVIAATEEERFSRVKHDQSFPQQAIDFCLEFGGIKTRDLDYVVFYEKPFIKFERNLTISIRYYPKSLGFFVESMKNFLSEKIWIKSIISQKLEIPEEKILFVPHHLSHAASAYYPSPFENAAYLILDAVGEWTAGSWGVCKDNKIKPMGEMRFPDSVGLLYSSFTSYLGFAVNDGEYKVMGMAGYGRPLYKDKVKKLYTQFEDGSIKLDLAYFSFQLSSEKMYSDKFEELFKGLDRFSLAASVQAVLEEIVIKMLNYIFQQTGIKNLVFGGGVALNSSLNGKITSESPFKDIFVFPAPGDDGGAVGSALYLFYHVLGNKKRYQILDVFLGEKFNVKKTTEKRIIKYIAGELVKGKVVAIYDGRAEFGPRALGHRSILADPRNSKMRDLVNTKIKFREEFRPFAPAVLAEYAQDYFSDINKNLAKFMLGTFRVKGSAKKFAPAIVHVDSTSRVQIVEKNYEGKLRGILEEFYKKTGVPILLNTSFNLKGEPIVNSEKDALETFKKSGLDILVMGNKLIEK